MDIPVLLYSLAIYGIMGLVSVIITTLAVNMAFPEKKMSDEMAVFSFVGWPLCLLFFAILAAIYLLACIVDLIFSE